MSSFLLSPLPAPLDWMSWGLLAGPLGLILMGLGAVLLGLNPEPEGDGEAG